jgi:hypothetical protein
VLADIEVQGLVPNVDGPKASRVRAPLLEQIIEALRDRPFSLNLQGSKSERSSDTGHERKVMPEEIRVLLAK